MQNHHHHFVSTNSSLSSSSSSGGRSATHTHTHISDSNQHQHPSFATMLQSGGSGNDPFPSQHGHDFKDFTTLTSVNGGGSEYGHLNSGGGGGGGHHNSNNHHHHGGGGHHGQHNNNNHHQHGESVVNSSSGGGGGGGSSGGSSTAKPKKPPPPNGKKTKGRVKIKMEFIDNKLRRYTTFSKRKTGIMKKAYELSTLTGTQVMLLVASETGHVYTFATRKLQPMITSEAGKALIQTCLNSPDPPNSGSDTQRMSATGYEETELTYAADPNGSDHDAKDGDESESMSSDEDGSFESGGGRDNSSSPATMIPLTNGLLPANFAALLAASSGLNAASLKAGGLSIGLVPAPVSSSTTSSSGLNTNFVVQQIPTHSHVVQPQRAQVRIEPTNRRSPQKAVQQQSPQKRSASGGNSSSSSPNKSTSSQPVKPSKIKREIR